MIEEGRLSRMNNEADLFLIIPRIPAGGSWEAKSINGVSC